MMQMEEAMNKKVITAIAIGLLMVATTILAFNSLKGFDEDIFATNFGDDDEDADF